MILYEFPFNERIRTYLRLEALFRRLGVLLGRDDAVDHHFALTTVFEIMEVAGRVDLKTDVLKDLERQRQLLDGLRGNPSISQGLLADVVQQIDRCATALGAQPGKVGQPLADNEWLAALRSRIGIPAGTCSFDLPAYGAWQHQPAGRRQADLSRWVEPLLPLGESVLLLLRLLRDGGLTQKFVAMHGQFQQTLPAGRSFQLLRLQLDDQAGVMPEISANRLMVSVRMMRCAPDGRVQPATGESAGHVAFDLTLCG
ncbi:MAG: cell division protein ZapD [Xylophilus ampelinus]